MNDWPPPSRPFCLLNYYQNLTDVDDGLSQYVCDMYFNFKLMSPINHHHRHFPLSPRSPLIPYKLLLLIAFLMQRIWHHHNDYFLFVISSSMSSSSFIHTLMTGLPFYGDDGLRVCLSYFGRRIRGQFCDLYRSRLSLSPVMEIKIDDFVRVNMHSCMHTCRQGPKHIQTCHCFRPRTLLSG